MTTDAKWLEAGRHAAGRATGPLRRERPAPVGRFRLGGRALDRRPKPAFVEAFRLLGAQMRSAMQQQGLRTLLVMGAYSGDGRSTAVANLGIALAETGCRVVLIDADTRHPGLAGLFPEAAGAGAPAEGGPSLLVAIPIGDTDITLWQPRPLRESPLDSAVLSAALSAASDLADIVILDSPACLPYSDAFALAPLVDGVLFVVRRRRQDVAAQRRIQEQLGRLGAKTLGAVYNEA